MVRPLTAHVIHLIIPAVKGCVPVSNVISAVMVTSQDHMITYPLDTLYCLLSVVQGRVGEYGNMKRRECCVCVCVCVCVYTCMFMCVY